MTLTPAHLARELDVPQKRVRDCLRELFGALPEGTTRWALDADRADAVRARFAALDGTRPLETVSVTDLLGQYAEILSELRTRGIVRTSNAPLGDYAEYVALQVYGGGLAPNSMRSYDIAAADGRSVQVKARTMAPTTSPSAVFSVFRSFDFDVATLMVFGASSYELLWVRELSPDVVREHARFSPHVNGHLLRIRSAEKLGVDVSERFMESLAEG